MATETSTYYFNAYNTGVEEWETTPANMVDGNTGNYGTSTINADIQLLTGNTCTADYLGKISKVELRLYGHENGIGHIDLRPVFSVDGDGSDYQLVLTGTPGWSSWHDITSDGNAPSVWTWTAVRDIDCDVELARTTGTWNVSKVDVRVTYDTSIIRISTDASTSTVYLDMPTAMIESANKSVQNLVFNDGTDVQLDRGKTSDSLTLSGTETSSVTSNMNDLDTFADTQVIVTVAGLPDSNLNTDYRISNFDFNKEAGMVDRYRYNISLERIYDRLG